MGVSGVAAERREVRAVWITTASALDWPKSRSVTEQQESLRAIVRSARAANLNTLFFQVRARGDAYYRSALEPWAENLTGVLGRDPGWDPLEFLLREAGAAGLEVHAWFNVYKIRGGTRPPPSTPPHPARAHPSWVVPFEGEGWFDPGIPEVHAYLLAVALDLVRRYDIDGLQLDFIRYPGPQFPDDQTFRRYGRGLPLDEWRRGNVNRFVAELYDSATALRPALKVGSAPVGVYRGANGWGGYTAYSQDAREWLRRGKQDYLAPQIYWDVGETKGDPDFRALVASWAGFAEGRHLYAGVGAYKPEVQAQIPLQIDIARTAGADGQAFFRLEHIADPSVFGGRYAAPAAVPPMPWKDPRPPNPPGAVAVTETAPGVFSVEWTAPPPAADGDRARFYHIYRRPSGEHDSLRALIAVAPAARTIHIDTLSAPQGIRYTYAVAAADRARNESALTSSDVSIRAMVDLNGRIAGETGLATLLRDDGPPLVAFALAARSEIVLDIREASSSGASPTVMAEGGLGAGIHVFGIPRGQFAPGRYFIRLRIDGTVLEQPLLLR